MGRRVENMVASVVIAVVTVLTYWPALRAPFIFDDHLAVLENSTIRALWPLSKVLTGPAQSTPLAGRPLVNLSLAANYAAGGLDPWGYHAVNIALHVLCALLLLGIVQRTLEQTPWGTRRFQESGPRAPLAVALAVALLWAVHPLNSEAVVYVTQRTELMVVFFFLLTLFCAIRGWEKGKSKSYCWFAAAIAACAAGMASKEVMISAPIAVLLYERTFITGSFAAALRRSWKLYLGLALTWVVLGIVLIARPVSETMGFHLGISGWDYLITQSGVLLYYLRLCFWPSGLTISYDWPLAHGVGQVLPQGLAVLGLLAITGLALWRWPAIGFLGAVFFMVLAPSSSIVPVVTELAVERRMYLPLAAVLALVVVGIWELVILRTGCDCPSPSGRGWRVFPPGEGVEVQPTQNSVEKCDVNPGIAGLPRPHPAGVPATLSRPRGGERGGILLAAMIGGVIVLALALATNRRLSDYRSEVSIWTDAVAKRPDNPTALSNLGTVLYRMGRVDEAVADFQRAVVLAPNNFETHNSLGSALMSQGKIEQAIVQFRAAVQLSPKFADAWYNLGNALARQGKFDEAIACYDKALAIDGQNADAWLNLGNVYLLRNQLEPATKALEKAVKLNPGGAAPHLALGNAWARAGHFELAGLQFGLAVALAPGNEDAHKSLGRVLMIEHRPTEAVEHFRRAVELSEHDAAALDGLGEALAMENHLREALDCFSQALAIKPDDVQVKRHRDRALEMLKQAATRSVR